jgi:hypothetical protein
MGTSLNGETLRKKLLDTIKDTAENDSDNFQSGVILGRVVRELNLRERDNIDEQQALLTFWQDLFRTGYLAWGYNIDNVEPPHCHLTEKGRRWLEHFSRDPANPDGYLAQLRKQAKLNPIAHSYIEEALQTYNSGCIKSAAVMVGAAAESLVLELRESLQSKMKSLGRGVPKDMLDWRIKRVLDVLEREIIAQKSNMPHKLADMFESFWSAFAQQIRLARNEAGHPKSIEAVTPETVHASLLIFPELAKLCDELLGWVSKSYV